ncbi:MAG: response regulator [Candidatus Dormibacteria bacterium]
MPTSATLARAASRGTKDRAILVADRDEAGRTGTASILTRLGFEVLPCDSAKAALAQARRRGCACAILDLNLGEMSAFELCRRLLAQSQWSWTPVIFTSLRAPRLDLRPSMQAGGFAYLPKPFRADSLMAAVGDALASKQSMRQTKPDRELVLAWAEASTSAG